MFTLTEYLPKGRGEDGTRTRNHLLAKQARYQLRHIPKKTMQAPGNRPESATLDEGVEPSLFTRW